MIITTINIKTSVCYDVKVVVCFNGNYYSNNLVELGLTSPSSTWSYGTCVYINNNTSSTNSYTVGDNNVFTKMVF